MARLGHYSPEDVIVLFGGVHKLSGFVDGTFINISKDDPAFVTRVTSDGMVTRRASSSPIYSVNLTLHSGSESNEILSYALKIDELTKMAKFPLIVKDTLGSTLFFAMTAWVENLPTSDFSLSMEDREWVIKCTQASFMVGGNESPSSLGQDALSVGLGLAGMVL